MTHWRISDRVSSHCLCMFQRKRWRKQQHGGKLAKRWLDLTSAGKNDQKLMHDESKREGRMRGASHCMEFSQLSRNKTLNIVPRHFCWRWTIDRTQHNLILCPLFCATIDDPTSCERFKKLRERQRNEDGSHACLLSLSLSLSVTWLHLFVYLHFFLLSTLHSPLAPVRYFSAYDHIQRVRVALVWTNEYINEWLTEADLVCAIS